MRQLPVDMALLTEFYQVHQGGFGDYDGAFLDTDSGEVVLIEHNALVEEEDAARFVRVPSVNTQESFGDMEDFAESLKNEDLQRRVIMALNGKGAFRRFKDVIREEPAVQKGWFAFRDARERDRLIAWLATHDIEPIEPSDTE